MSAFEIWWVDRRRQIRPKTSDSRYLCHDFAEFIKRFRPGRPLDVDHPVRDLDSRS